MNLTTFLAEVRRYRKTFLAVAGSVFLIGLAAVLLTPAKFVSTTQLMVSISGSTTAAAYQNDSVVAGRVNSYLELLTSDVISQRVVDRLHLAEPAHVLASRVSATRVPPNTSVIDVAVTAGSREDARQLADAVADEFISYTTALETPTGEDGQKVHVTKIGGANEPRDNTVERAILVLLSALLGILLGAVAVWIRAITDPVVRDAGAAATVAELPVPGDVLLVDTQETPADGTGSPAAAEPVSSTDDP